MTRARTSALVAVAGALLAVAPAGVAAQAAPSASASAKKPKTVTVCRRGCAFSSIQKAVNRVRKGGTVRIRPGTYVQGVVVPASKDGITITGTAAARRVVLQGRGAKDADGQPAQNGVFVDGADRVTIRNLTARNYPANGFFVRNCDGYMMRGLVAAFNRAYGLYAFNCVGGRMTRSRGYGHGDSAFYVGADAGPGQPQAHAAGPPDRLSQRARLLRHQLQVRRHHGLRVLQQRRRHRAEHALARSCSRRPSRARSRTTGSTGTTSTTSGPTRPSSRCRRPRATSTTRRASVSSCSARRAGRSPATTSSATSSSAC